MVRSLRSYGLPVASVLAVAALAGCGKAPARSSQTAAPRLVRVQAVSLTAPERVVTYSGTVQARVLAPLGFRVAGKIIERPVNIGDHIVPGQVLARLDPNDLRYTMEADVQAVAAAAADARNAQADFARYQSLGARSPAYIPSQYDKLASARAMADARLAQARRALAQAADQLDYATLRADAEGVVTALPAEAGQVVAAAQPVAMLAHTAQTEIDVDVPENSLADMEAAKSVTVSLWSAPDTILHGNIREVGALADPSSRTYAVRVTLRDARPDLVRLGMTASVRFARPAAQRVAVLPGSALVDKDGAPAVWRLDPLRRRASLMPVQVAAYLGDGNVALRGLPDGAQIVTAGAAELDPGMDVAAWSGPVR